MTSIYSILFFISGLIIGSFLNVLSDRIPKNKKFLINRSCCDYCKKTLHWYDLIPLLSFISTLGKCRYCKKKLSFYYPFSEILTGFMFAFVYLNVFDMSPIYLASPTHLLLFIIYLIIVSCFIVIFLADLKYGIIPDKVLITALVFIFVYIFLFQISEIHIYLLSGFLAMVFFLLILLVTRGKGMGMGDVKYVFVMGLFLGFPGIVIGLYIAFLTGFLVSIILIVWKKKHFRKDTIPFGPFLVLGTILTLFYSEKILKIILPYLGL